MIVDNLETFESILNKDTIKTYLKVANSEDLKIFTPEIFIIAYVLQTHFKTRKEIYFRNNSILLFNKCSYFLNRLIKNCERDEILEQSHETSLYTHKLEIESNNILHDFVKTTIDNPELINEANIISRSYLYSSALCELNKQIHSYYEVRLKQHLNDMRGISTYIPNDIDISINKTKVEEIHQHIKVLKKDIK